MPFTTANDLKIYYEIHGEGEPLFLISGFSQNHLSWKAFVPTLSQHFQVVCFDNRGAGQTDAPEKGYSIEQLSQDTVALMDKLEIESAHFMGESMGTAITLQTCVDHPDRVKKAVLCAPFSHFPEITKNTVRNQLHLLTAGVDYSLLVEMNASWVLSNKFMSMPGKLESYYEKMRTNPYPISKEGIFGQAHALLEFDLRDQLDKIPHEILLLIGEQDIATPPYCAEEIMKKTGSASMHLFKDVGHQFNFEIPEQSAKAALAFLQK